MSSKWLYTTMQIEYNITHHKNSSSWAFIHINNFFFFVSFLSKIKTIIIILICYYTSWKKKHSLQTRRRRYMMIYSMYVYTRDGFRSLRVRTRIHIIYAYVYTPFIRAVRGNSETWSTPGRCRPCEKSLCKWTFSTTVPCPCRFGWPRKTRVTSVGPRTRNC